MVIGVDFDNTIACYDRVFRDVALERAWVPATTAATKVAVREHLCRAGREDLWTELQGDVYGARMPEAVPFPGVLDFLRQCRECRVPVYVISHRTKYPHRGTRCDLHAAARAWLAARGFHDPDGPALPLDAVHFRESRHDKLTCIGEQNCSHFVEDLVEVLKEPAFPPRVRKILFDPSGAYPECRFADRAESWTDVGRLLGLTEIG